MRPQIKALATGLALLASAALGRPSQKRSDQLITTAISHTMTAWGDQIRIYYTEKNVEKNLTQIQELCNSGLGFHQNYQYWTKCSTLGDFNIVGDIAVVNTYGTNDPGIEVYGFDDSGNFCSYEYRKEWKATIIRPILNRKPDSAIRAASWVEGGVVHRSIFYNSYNSTGEAMKEITKANGDDEWHIVHVGASLTHFAVSATQEFPANGRGQPYTLEKQVWTLGAQVTLFRNSWSVYDTPWGKPNWTGSGPVAALKLAEGIWRFYRNSGDGRIIEEGAEINAPVGKDKYRDSWTPVGGDVGRDVGEHSKISAAFVRKESAVMVFVLHENKPGALAIAWCNGLDWLSSAVLA